MQTKFARQTWTFDPNYTRVEALDSEGQPLGYVYFVPRTHRRTSAGWHWQSCKESQGCATGLPVS